MADYNSEARMYLQGEMYVPERLVQDNIKRLEAEVARLQKWHDIRDRTLLQLGVETATLRERQAAAEQLADVVAHAIPLLQAGGRMEGLDYHDPYRVAINGLNAALAAWRLSAPS